ncbi:transcription factor UPBEAT1-like [Pyrus ussuriensis x Pyrus communis]|uniref:Transcription factor UPBEAT1-like n=1 Tax=Pyrus ussuriensis x Pyrus communis TaxID=2448454 RepID=A0A5N5G8R0_9ROSA|nr:transcription factor UPBEAT1-like [Pyrus x bretschneideri]KAB2611733.1 transcription factor UPBEAT1-like [Pyrus ussuriensis x Pyrus communis]
MGSQQPLLVSLGLKGTVLETEGKSYTNGALWNITRESGGVVVRNKRSPRRRILKKKKKTWTRLQSARRLSNNIGIKRRVKTLKGLIPNSEDSTGLDGLFRDTADYILSLQTRVRLMQIMVQAFAAGSDHQ